MKKSSFLIPVQRIICSIKIKNDWLTSGFVIIKKQLDKQIFYFLIIPANLIVPVSKSFSYFFSKFNAGSSIKLFGN